MDDDVISLTDDLDAVAAYLRTAGPIRSAATPDGSPVWVVTRYADVRTLLNDPRLSLDKANSAGREYRGFRLPPALDRNLLNLDPPDHTRLRRMVSREFTTRRVEALRPRMRSLVAELLDRIDGQDEAELMTALALPLPVTVIGDLLGVAADDLERFRTWSTTLMAPTPDQGPDDAKKAVVGLHGLLASTVAAKRRTPGDDLVSDLITAGDSLTEDELTSLAFLILFAGHETTVNLIGNGVDTLLRHPAQLAALRSSPSLMPSAVDEILRFASPVPYAIRRFPLVDIPLVGRTIPAGSTVLLSLDAAHRDPARFPDPDTFDIARTGNAHLSFGYGIHHCLGRVLAREETEIALAMLFDRFPGLAPSGPAVPRPSYRSRGLRDLPVRL